MTDTVHRPVDALIRVQVKECPGGPTGLFFMALVIGRTAGRSIMIEAPAEASQWPAEQRLQYVKSELMQRGVIE